MTLVELVCECEVVYFRGAAAVHQYHLICLIVKGLEAL